jgi:uroporphyrinogen decarboxylase
MTQRELFHATVEHRQADGLLFYADFTDDLQARVRARFGIPRGEDSRDFFGMFRPFGVSPRRGAPAAAHDFSAYYADIDIPAGGRINSEGVLRLPGSMYHFTRLISPLRNAAALTELEAFPWEFLDPANYSAAHMAREAADLQARGRAVFTWVGRFYEDAWQYRGYEELLMDMHADPDMAEFIFDKLFAMNMFRAVAAAQAGVDYITSGDDVASQKALMFSPETWRRYQKSRWAEIYQAAKRIHPNIKIWYHSDGDVTAIVDELVEIGVDILNPVQPECMDPAALKKRYGNRLTIDGAIGTQSTMPFGTPGELRRAVTQAVETLGAGGGYILAPSHILEPEVPIANIEAFIETAQAY